MTKQTIKKFTPCIITLVAVGAVSFYAGVQYGHGSSTQTGQQGGNFANMTAAERQARFANSGFAGGGQRTGGARTNGGGFVAGEILSKDAQSITVKLPDGGSKIVFLSDTTKIMKSATGTVSDLTIGAQVTTMGTANADGSVSAQSIQLR